MNNFFTFLSRLTMLFSVTTFLSAQVTVGPGDFAAGMKWFLPKWGRSALLCLLFFSGFSLYAQTTSTQVTICGNFAGETGYEAPRMVIDGMGVVILTDNTIGDVWCTTLTLTEGQEIRYFFQYSIPGAAPAEDLTALEGDCVTNGRRTYTATAIAATVTNAWESCSPTTVSPIPTLGQWGIIALFLISMVIGIVVLRARNSVSVVRS